MNIRKISPSDESLFNEWLSKDELHKANGINSPLSSNREPIHLIPTTAAREVIWQAKHATSRSKSR